jgi:hypothetical protein
MSLADTVERFYVPRVMTSRQPNRATDLRVVGADSCDSVVRDCNARIAELERELALVVGQRDYAIKSNAQNFAELARAEALSANAARLTTLVGAFRQMLVRQKRSPYVLNCMTESYFYDEAECDGFCLLEDIDAQLALSATEGKGDAPHDRANEVWKKHWPAIQKDTAK